MADFNSEEEADLFDDFDGGLGSDGGGHQMQ